MWKTHHYYVGLELLLRWVVGTHTALHRNPSSSLTRSLPLVSPFQGCLTRIFHTDSAAACEHLMDTASASNCSSGSMKHTAVVAIHHLPCLYQNSRRLATNQYEISGLSVFAASSLRSA
ncbi:MAG: hypothetical protein K9M81_02175 [Chthoniobacterales bacterium]|nr:hypothetical protein [Chthoniobacterales bacterium]